VAAPVDPKSTLPARIGPITDVQVSQDAGAPPPATTYRPATVDFAFAVARTVRNALGLPKQYHYGLDGETLYHTGTKATFAYVSPASLDDPSKVLEPDELEVLAATLAVLFPFEGEQLEASQQFLAMAAWARQQVMGG
jgi:hypothetical protein